MNELLTEVWNLSVLLRKQEDYLLEMKNKLDEIQEMVLDELEKQRKGI